MQNFFSLPKINFEGLNENQYSVNKGNYMELLISNQGFLTLLQERLDTSTVFRDTSVSIQNDLIFKLNFNLKLFI